MTLQEIQRRFNVNAASAIEIQMYLKALGPPSPPLAERVHAALTVLTSRLTSLRYAAPEMHAYWWQEIDEAVAVLAALTPTTPQAEEKR